MADSTEHAFEGRATIAASPDKVWAVLVDSGRWAEWDSGVDGVDGMIEPGAKIVIRAKIAPGRTFPVKVTTFDAPRRLVFTGGMPLGLFKGVRTYTLTPAGKETDFTMREEYSGVMLGAIWKSIPDLSPSFAQFARGLKARVESGS
ncbi:MAG: SRPBCC domain-containing protein [Pseudolysinimonas sp.]